jgi:hypothetical protein
VSDGGRPPRRSRDARHEGPRLAPRILIHDQADRDAISSLLMRYRDARGDDWADIIDMLTLQPEARRRVVRLLAEIDAAAGG